MDDLVEVLEVSLNETDRNLDRMREVVGNHSPLGLENGDYPLHEWDDVLLEDVEAIFKVDDRGNDSDDRNRPWAADSSGKDLESLHANTQHTESLLSDNHTSG